MNYISTVQTAEKWGISISRIAKMCKAGQIPGAIQIGSRWMIPENTNKPADGRTKAAKAENRSDDFFRFPLYVNFSEDSYVPPLSEEEWLLRRAQQEFYACRFEEAKKLLLPLSENGMNRYVRIAALYHLCCMAIYDERMDYDRCLLALNMELAQDFPFRKEMLLLRYMHYADLADYKPALEEFCIDPAYAYHPSTYDLLMPLSLISIENGNLALLSELRYDAFELLCQQMERDGHYMEAQKLHYLLLVVYQLQNNTDRALFHVRRGLQLALDRELYWYAAIYAHYYPNVTRKALKDLPPDFGKRIRSVSSMLYEKYQEFEYRQAAPSFISLLSGKDYELAFLASQGYTNRDIAQKLKVSEKTVSRMYGKICDKLNIKTKRELTELINHTHKGEAE